MSKLIYCATPSRLSERIRDILDYVTEKGHGPLHPFLALPYERFEGGVVGREKLMEFCFRLVDICDEFWMFGVSDGTLREAVHAIEVGKLIALNFDWFDEDCLIIT